MHIDFATISTIFQLDFEIVLMVLSFAHKRLKWTNKDSRNALKTKAKNKMCIVLYIPTK